MVHVQGRFIDAHTFRTVGVLRAFVLPMGLDAGPTPPGLCRAGSGVCRGDLRPDLPQEFEGGVSIFSGHG
jgi:hypothetical protein